MRSHLYIYARSQHADAQNWSCDYIIHIHKSKCIHGRLASCLYLKHRINQRANVHMIRNCYVKWRGGHRIIKAITLQRTKLLSWHMTYIVLYIVTFQDRKLLENLLKFSSKLSRSYHKVNEDASLECSASIKLTFHIYFTD